ncbi:rap guanine nucleotide exchange factor-like 1 [Tachysurus ichikawai]
MPAGMKPLEKFLKKQTNALTRAGGFGGEKAAAGTSAARRRASLSRVVPFFRESSPEGGPARGDVFSPETEEAPCWPSAAATDIRSPSLSSDEQSSEASLDTGWTPLPADTPENLALALLDSVAGKRYGNCTGTAHESSIKLRVHSHRYSENRNNVVVLQHQSHMCSEVL